MRYLVAFFLLAMVSAALWHRLGHRALPGGGDSRHIGSRYGDISAPKAREVSRSHKYPGVTDPKFRELIPWKQAKLNGSQLSIHAAARLGCFEGDLDAVRADLARPGGKRLLLSLEPIAPEDTAVAPQTREVTADQLAKGIRIGFTVPADKKAHQLGLFLCKDAGEAGRCAGKDAKDIMQIIGEDAVASAQRIPTAAQDRIYFFQYLFLEADGTLEYFETSPIAPQALDRIEAKLPSLFSGADAVNREMKALELARKLNKTIASVPITFDARGLKMVLPANDPAHCPSLAEMRAQGARSPNSH